MRDRLDLMPFEPGGVLDRLLQFRRRAAVRDDIEPITIAAILGDPLLIGRESDHPCRRGEPLHLDQAKLARLQIAAPHSVAELLLSDLEYSPPRRLLALCDVLRR